MNGLYLATRCSTGELRTGKYLEYVAYVVTLINQILYASISFSVAFVEPL